MLTLTHVDVHYGRVQALRRVSMEIRDGEMAALVGANGAGKTTTLRAISGLVAPSNGEILFGGVPIQGLPAHRVVEMGVAHVPEGRELFPQLSVLENLRMGYWPVRRDRGSYGDRVERAFDYFPILRERSGQAAGTLSGGEQQMLAVARGLMSAPQLLLIDELSLGLAPMIVAQLFDILRRVNQSEGTAILLVEQFVHMALGNTDHAYVLSKGEVVRHEQSATLLADPALLESYLGAEVSARAR